MKPASLEKILRALEGPDAQSRYASGVVLLTHALEEDAPDLLRRARAVLREAVALDDTSAVSHAMLGHALDHDESTLADALAAVERAHRLEPSNVLHEVYWLTLRAEQAEEDSNGEALLRGDIERAAVRQGIDLASIADDLEAARFPVNARTLLKNGFLHARNFFSAFLRDEYERILEQAEPGRAAAMAKREAKECEARRKDLERRTRTSRVPEPFRHLTPWAQRLGVGDDGCRARFTAQLTDVERSALEAAVTPYAAQIHAWLDTFAAGRMTPEAEAFLYLLLAREELPPPAGGRP